MYTLTSSNARAIAAPSSWLTWPVKMASDHSTTWPRSSRGTPITDAITREGTSRATSAIQSKLPRCRASSSVSQTISRIQPSKCATTRGPKDFSATRRTRLCSGGSMNRMCLLIGPSPLILANGKNAPGTELNSAACCSISTTSLNGGTTQNPPLNVPSAALCQYSPGRERKTSNASCGIPTTYVAGSVKSGISIELSVSVLTDTHTSLLGGGRISSHRQAPSRLGLLPECAPLHYSVYSIPRCARWASSPRICVRRSAVGFSASQPV